MKDEIIGIRAYGLENQLYNFTAVYNPNDCTQDKTALLMQKDGVQLVYRVEVWAENIIEAVNKGTKTVLLQRAEEMTDYVLSHPTAIDRDTLSRREIEQIRDSAIDSDLFTSWLMITPTSIQCNLEEDEELLKTATLENTLSHIGHTGDKAEEFLKGLDDDS